MVRWSIPEAANVVKVVFFDRSVAASGTPRLRYSEIRSTIDSSRPISHRTLSRSLQYLVDRKEITKAADGLYELTLEFSREDIPAVVLAADAMSINAGAAVGLVGNQRQGWTIYGVPKGKPRSLRPQLRVAAIEFQNRIDTILRSEARQILVRVLARARRRGLSAREARETQRIAAASFDYLELLRMEHLDSFAWVQIMEKLAPGALSRIIERMVRPPIGILEDMWSNVVTHVSMSNRPEEWIPYLARLHDEGEGAIRKLWPKLTADAKRGAEAFEKLRQTVLSKDWQHFQKQWSSILLARYWMCAVVR